VERVLITDRDQVATEILIDAAIGSDAGTVLPERPARSRVAVFTQPTTRALADGIAGSAAAAGYQTAVHVLPDREAAKTLQIAEECYLWLNSIGMTRSDTVVAVGGGAATDLGGFVGATYLRGVETVLVPTTLLAAVDAAIGGKTAVNVGGKNLAGVFRHPARVVVDTAVLDGLPEDLLIEGAAEAVKAGFIADPGLVALFQRHGLAAPISEVVTRALKVKAAVVSDDFTEQGRRAFLNYGHTVGHAIEYVAGIPHGHAVAIGMVAAGAASGMITGFNGGAEQRELLAALQLPIVSPPAARDAVEAAMALDKKRDSTGLRMVLLEAFGKPIVTAVDPTTVRAALRAVGID